MTTVETVNSVNDRQVKLSSLKETISANLIGQSELVEAMLVCLLSNGHMLIEGMPGLAKTTAAKAISEGIEGKFQRIQFTPDLLPSDLIGTEIYIHESSSFVFREGPLFSNIVLADEINRAPAKVQSALLEAMEENQITVGHKSYKLPDMYMVIATQNPIEQEGTYNLPEAQLDRFLMHILVDYPTQEEELRVIDLLEGKGKSAKKNVSLVTTQKEIMEARKDISQVHVSDKLKEYMVSLSTATRYPERFDSKLSGWIEYGVSPRATIGLLNCSKSLAWIYGSSYVTPAHIQKIISCVFRHRIRPSFEAEAEGISRNDIINYLLEVVAVP